MTLSGVIGDGGPPPAAGARSAPTTARGAPPWTNLMTSAFDLALAVSGRRALGELSFSSNSALILSPIWTWTGGTIGDGPRGCGGVRVCPAAGGPAAASAPPSAAPVAV